MAFETASEALDELQFSEDNRFLICSGFGSPARLLIWDVESGEEIISETDRVAFSGIASISPLEIAVGTADSIVFFNLANPEELERWRGIPGIVFGLAASPDRKQLASAGWDGIVRLWDLPRRENPIALRGDQIATRHLSFSPSGRHWLAASRKDDVVLWDLPSGREKLRLLEEYDQSIQSATFSPAGERILAGVNNDTLMVWSTERE